MNFKTIKVVFAVIRPHQWVKNMLVFLPLLAAHRWADADARARVLLYFAAFCCAASAVYIFNDWMDMESDRAHPQKRRRPLAAGTLSPRVALLMFPSLLLGAGLLAACCGIYACTLLVLYVLLNLFYTLRLKRVALLDVIVLAGYYVMRVIGGAVAAGVILSPWLSSMCMFLFLSIAIAKRYAELKETLCRQATMNTARGYQEVDEMLLAMIGVNCGLLAVMVLTLYINSEHVTMLYRHPWLIWGICPILLYWICRVWLLASRGELHEDPVVFALRDRVSHCLAAACLVLVWLAAPIPS